MVAGSGRPRPAARLPARSVSARPRVELDPLTQLDGLREAVPRHGWKRLGEHRVRPAVVVEGVEALYRWAPGDANNVWGRDGAHAAGFDLEA
jgi:hypothetical protein